MKGNLKCFTKLISDIMNTAGGCCSNKFSLWMIPYRNAVDWKVHSSSNEQNLAPRFAVKSVLIVVRFPKRLGKTDAAPFSSG